jgi:hypothetical protein
MEYFRDGWVGYIFSEIFTNRDTFWISAEELILLAKDKNNYGGLHNEYFV